MPEMCEELAFEEEEELEELEEEEEELEDERAVSSLRIATALRSAKHVATPHKCLDNKTQCLFKFNKPFNFKSAMSMVWRSNVDEASLIFLSHLLRKPVPRSTNTKPPPCPAVSLNMQDSVPFPAPISM